MKHFQLRNRKGQSLIEALVALSLLMTALLGIETLLTRSFLLDRVTTDQTKATYLASEGIEIMKSLLDHQVYDALANPGGVAGDPDTGGWNSFCNFTSGSNTYQVDWTTTSCPLPTSQSDATPIKFDATTGPYGGLYGYNDSAASPSAFTRIVKVTKIIDPATGFNNEIDVQSTVTWSTGVMTGQSLTLEDHFYNWNPGD
jgi:Tfp pilus assembly protein PilV